MINIPSTFKISFRALRVNKMRSALTMLGIIIGTEEGLLHRLKKESPDKTFHLLSRKMVCPNMKRTKLESVLTAMEKMQYVIKVPEDIRVKAKRALDRMLQIT